MQQKDSTVGFIYGDVGSTEFNFTVNSHNIRKFDYIYAPHKEGDMLAQVMDIKQLSDLKFEEAANLTSNDELPYIKNKVSAFADVILPPAIAGIECEGTAYRMDHVPLHLRKVKDAPGECLTDREILERIIEKVKEKKGE